MGTIPLEQWAIDSLPSGVAWLKGQHELGASGYSHVQCVAALHSKSSLSATKALFGGVGHWELTRSVAADQYVHKDETAIEGTRFEYGSRALKQNCKRDWDSVWLAAVSGNLGDLPASLRVIHYRTLRAIREDHLQPVAMARTALVYYGGTGVGKSHRAWDEAGMDSYCKDSRTKFWNGYRGQTHVIFDEFRGAIDVGHLLRWLDKYPCMVELKGSATALCATRYWFTSNLHPRDWYPGLDAGTLEALLRRLTIVHLLSLDNLVPE